MVAGWSLLVAAGETVVEVVVVVPLAWVLVSRPVWPGMPVEG